MREQLLTSSREDEDQPVDDGVVHPDPGNCAAGSGSGIPFRGSHRTSGSALPWEKRYRCSVIAGDLIAIASVIGTVALVDAVTARTVFVPAFALLTAVVVLSVLALRKAWTPRLLGEGAEEFRKVGEGMFTAAVLLALISVLIRSWEARPWIFVMIPLMYVLAVVLRYALRRLLHRKRRDGACMLPVVAAGSRASVQDFIARTREQSHVGWQVEAACIVNAAGAEDDAGEIDGVPVVGELEELAEWVRQAGYRVVAITPAPSYWTPQRLQELSWELERTPAELVVAPVLMEAAGPRFDVSGVLGMPMLRVTPPAFTGGRRMLKELADRIAAALLLVLTLPMMFVVAVVIKLDDGGPVFFRQERVKRGGETFRMWKFRTMVMNADEQWVQLAERHGDNVPQFKLRADPRVTRVGAVLRRLSLDELPQLFNVLTGSMSLVGPRPPLPRETQAYDAVARRRLLVKPGITGLWQVSGRSDLSWEESVRLDLRYVQDWSLALDAAILWKTVRAVVSGRGAY